jgi:putative oxygen-independent coproporphyrinogen III oxidase
MMQNTSSFSVRFSNFKTGKDFFSHKNKSTAETVDDLFGLYCHWPFCLSKCPYCDFASGPVPDGCFHQKAFLAAYIRDLNDCFSLHINTDAPKRHLTSLFFGGGTPSLMPLSLIEQIINEAQKRFSFAPDIEISIEANPETVDLRKMRSFKSLGINRLSLGVQALNDEDLKIFKRPHTLKTALKRIEEAHSVFNNFSIDLIYARPSQTQEQWAKELEKAIALDLPHLSCYQLTLEEGTPFFEDKSLILPDDDTQAQMLTDTWERLKSAGLFAYEISNFAKDGFECRHNKSYWLGADYLGIGPAAHGRIGKIATEQERFFSNWLQNPMKKTTLTAEEKTEEKILMGLRLFEGIPLPQGIQEKNIRKMAEKGWLDTNAAMCGRLKASDTGRLFLNRLIEGLLED